MTSPLSRLAAALADRYRIERELGAGGMATVYLAEDIKHDRKVAIKVLRPELAAVIGAERFLTEIKTTANLQHPHILSLFDSGTVEGTVFYVMPFVEGESLRDRLSREKQLPVDEALRISREVADALQYAHQHGVIHRDIKPENILLQGGHALVADFGIAVAAAKTGGSRMTETGMSLGTPQYMSPEQASDAGGRWGEPVERLPRGTIPAWSPDGRSILFASGIIGGTLEILPADSGAGRVLLDASAPGMPFPEAIRWSANGLVYFQAHDATGATTFWSIPAAGGSPKLLIRLDPALYSTGRLSFSIGNGRFYFPVEDHQSDIWVMEVGRP